MSEKVSERECERDSEVCVCKRERESESESESEREERREVIRAVTTLSKKGKI